MYLTWVFSNLGTLAACNSLLGAIVGVGLGLNHCSRVKTSEIMPMIKDVTDSPRGEGRKKY